MSGKVSGWVWDQDLPQALKFLLLAYADHADHDGRNVYPSLALIARKTGYSERHVRRLTRALEELGYLVPLTEQKGGRHRTNRWRIPISGGRKGDTGVSLSENGLPRVRENGDTQVPKG